MAVKKVLLYQYITQEKGFETGDTTDERWFLSTSRNTGTFIFDIQNSHYSHKFVVYNNKTTNRGMFIFDTQKHIFTKSEI